MANKYIQIGLPPELYKRFQELLKKEERTVSKMGEILIREALGIRLFGGDK